MISESYLEKYFARHPLSDKFLAAESSLRSAAFAAARRDLLAVLGREPDESEELAAAALCEQTLHILLHPEYFSAAEQELASESVSGIGRRTYFRNREGITAAQRFSPRARDYLAAWLKPCGTLKTGR